MLQHETAIQTTSQDKVSQSPTNTYASCCTLTVMCCRQLRVVSVNNSISLCMKPQPHRGKAINIRAAMICHPCRTFQWHTSHNPRTYSDMTSFTGPPLGSHLMTGCSGLGPKASDHALEAHPTPGQVLTRHQFHTRGPSRHLVHVVSPASAIKSTLVDSRDFWYVLCYLPWHHRHLHTHASSKGSLT